MQYCKRAGKGTSHLVWPCFAAGKESKSCWLTIYIDNQMTWTQFGVGPAARSGQSKPINSLGFVASFGLRSGVHKSLKWVIK
eukprot:5434044-Amphidinium_carterae.2